MSEQTLPPSTSWAGRDVLSFLWRVLASPKIAAVLSILLAAVVLLALLFSPQHPGPSANATELAQWTSDVQERFGRWYDILSTFGLLNLSTAIWLRGLLALSALTLMVSLADGVAQVARAWRYPNVRQAESFFRTTPGAAEWYVSQERFALVEVLAQQLAWPAWLPWSRLRIRPRREEASQASYLCQDWLTWRRVGSLLTHFGLLLMLTGVALNTRLGWRQEGVMLMPGQTVPLAEQPELSLRLESMEGWGTGRQAAGRVALDGPGGSSLMGPVAVGRPYTAHGVTVYQREVGPILRVSARDADGATAGSGTSASIPLADASADVESADEVRLWFTESRVENYLLIEDIRKVVRLVLYRQGEAWDPRHDELQIEVYAGNLDTPEAQRSIVGEGSVDIKGIAYEFAWEQYAVLDVVRSSCQWLVRVGMGLALLGLVVTLLLPPARLWLRVVAEESDTCVIRLAGEMSGRPESLAAWLAGWRQRLGEGKADE